VSRYIQVPVKDRKDAGRRTDGHHGSSGASRTEHPMIDSTTSTQTKRGVSWRGVSWRGVSWR
jgi:hypothetical protein